MVRGEIPADEFALYDVMRELSGVEFEVERVIQSGDEAVMPLIWIRNTMTENLQELLEKDSSSKDVTLLSTFEDEQLYRMEWISEIDVVLQMLTTSQATVMDAYGHQGCWYLRVLYPDRESLTKTNEFVEDEGLTFDVTAVRPMEGKPVGRYGLTESQYEALTVGLQTGYFEIPRKTPSSELADQLNISHQALSERLRRAQEALVEDALVPARTPVQQRR